MNVPLHLLARAVGVGLDDDRPVSGITHDSRRVRPGDLFVALPGTKLDGAQYVADAIARGAVAVCVDTAAARTPSAAGPANAHPAVPLLVVQDPRLALAQLAAALHGEPARDLRMIGLTGTLGKTSTALLAEAALTGPGAARDVGVVGSLGARVSGPARARVPDGALPDLDGMTTPDPPMLHRALRVMRDAGVRTVVMEVTSHALAQRRVDGITYALGGITNLVPNEHLDFHGTPENYLRTKARFLELLAPDAPLVFNADDALVRKMVAESLAKSARPIVGVSLGETARALRKDPDDLAARDSAVCADDVESDAQGTRFVLSVRRELPRLDGGVVPKQDVPVQLSVLGIQQLTNAALAATIALVAGAPADELSASLARTPAMRRRMEVVHAAAPLVIDDTAGHPDTLRAVFGSIGTMRRSALRVAFGLRGSRGVEINVGLAETLAELVIAQARTEPVQLVVTWSDDTAGPRDRVTDDERAAAMRVFRAAFDALPPGARLTFDTHASLANAVDALLGDVRDDELVLLLGAQGMDRAAERTRATLAERG
jgi:UDP-N-acetylmuramoyl-L-alanyl-D-glutamate--2,6-diaminopimelate ligase